MNNQINGLKEHRVLRIRMRQLLGLGRLLRLIQNGIETLVEARAHRRVVRRRIILQQAQQLHAEPRRRHKIVRVVLKVRVRGGDDAREARHGERHARLVLVRVAPHQHVYQADRGRDDAQMLVVQQVDDPGGPLARRHDVLARLEQLEETEGGALLHAVDRIARHEQLGNVVRERLGHLHGADVGDALQRQCDEDGVARGQVDLDVLDDEAHELVLVVQYYRYEKIALVGEIVCEI